MQVLEMVSHKLKILFYFRYTIQSILFWKLIVHWESGDLGQVPVWHTTEKDLYVSSSSKPKWSTGIDVFKANIKC